MEIAKEGALRREIGFFGSVFLSFNGVVGAGVFALPAVLYTQFGAFSPWLFPIFGLLVLIIALPFSRLGAYYPLSGGPAMYASAFGPMASFQVGWIYYIARSSGLAGNTSVFVLYASSFAPQLATGWPRVLAILGLCGTLTLINILGVRRATRFIDAMTLLKAAPLLLFALYALSSFGAPIPAPGPLPALSEVELAALLVLYAFIGFENSTVPAGETANPGRNIPRALITTIFATMLLYFLIQLAYVTVMPRGAGGDTPLVAFGVQLAGPIGGIILTATALFSLTGNLMSALTATPRVTFALARDGLLPKWFAKVHPRFQTPANSILFMGLLVALLGVSGSFVWLAVVSTVARMIVYSVSIAALPIARRRAGVVSSPGGTVMMWLSVIGALGVCVWAASQSEWLSWRTLLVLIAVGTGLYLIARFGRKSDAEPKEQ